MIPLPPRDIYFLSFINMYSFYSKCIQWFETNIKSVRRHWQLCYLQIISILLWSPLLINLFDNYKTNLISSSLLLIITIIIIFIIIIIII